MTAAVRFCCGSRLSHRLAVTFNQFGKYHQPLGSRANIVRGITGDERQFRVLCRIDHADIFRHHDLSRRDFINKSSSIALDLYLIAFGEFIYVTKKGIAMTGDYSIPGFARLGGLLHVSRPFREVFDAMHPQPQWRQFRSLGTSEPR